MTCEKVLELISDYMDGMLSKEEKKVFEKHVNECDECSIYFQNYKLMIDSLNEIEEVDVPEGFNEQLHDKLLKENTRTKRRTTKKYFSVAAAVVILIGAISAMDHLTVKEGYDLGIAQEQSEISGLGSEQIGPSIENNNLLDKNIESQYETETRIEDTVDEVVAGNMKIIKQGKITLEVDAFDLAYGNIIRKVENSNGYVENSNIYTRGTYNNSNEMNQLKTGEIKIRIPEDQFLNIFREVKGQGEVVEEIITGENATQKYHDTENEMLNLTLQEDRLRDILDQAETVDDILKIEKELTRIRGKINELTLELKHYDKEISFSTIRLILQVVESDEVQVLSTQSSTMSRAKENFLNSINSIISFGESLLLGFFTILPLGIIMGIIAILVYMVYKRNKK
ncbi:DUF4349 domain-containing protein [Serpentinicella sp. ANB-PHB4]|uniref:DUF4349 domain-containing protein n=1 Tax=Serpentinicella sp. ANB-PHB4 TaxID=3074076 RepID=UPI00285CFF3F|nr:DUF4349 domain-containing protein [Serpentinicella sp. ANB-PHB4]MDR5659502.1 DUF4349 domain-containing protein [Serpentinicella sp. ANB-PHB4]